MLQKTLFFVESFVSLFVSDLDFSSIYPTLMRCLNISRGTLRRAVFAISGRPFEDIQRYFSNLINVRENCVVLFKDYFGCPGYAEMDKLFEEELKKKGKDTNGTVDTDSNN